MKRYELTHNITTAEDSEVLGNWLLHAAEERAVSFAQVGHQTALTPSTAPLTCRRSILGRSITPTARTGYASAQRG